MKNNSRVFNAISKSDEIINGTSTIFTKPTDFVDRPSTTASTNLKMDIINKLNNSTKNNESMISIEKGADMVKDLSIDTADNTISYVVTQTTHTVINNTQDSLPATPKTDVRVNVVDGLVPTIASDKIATIQTKIESNSTEKELFKNATNIKHETKKNDVVFSTTIRIDKYNFYEESNKTNMTNATDIDVSLISSKTVINNTSHVIHEKLSHQTSADSSSKHHLNTPKVIYHKRINFTDPKVHDASRSNKIGTSDDFSDGVATNRAKDYINITSYDKEDQTKYINGTIPNTMVENSREAERLNESFTQAQAQNFTETFVVTVSTKYDAKDGTTTNSILGHSSKPISSSEIDKNFAIGFSNDTTKTNNKNFTNHTKVEEKIDKNSSSDDLQLFHADKTAIGFHYSAENHIDGRNFSCIDNKCKNDATCVETSKFRNKVIVFCECYL